LQHATIKPSSARPSRSRASQEHAARAPGGAAPAAAHSARPAVSLMPTVQCKVVIGRPNDPYEREADAASARVSAGQLVPAVSTLPPGGLAVAQRQPESDETPSSPEPESEAPQSDAPASEAAESDTSEPEASEPEPSGDAEPVQRAASGSAELPRIEPEVAEKEPEQQPARTIEVQRAEREGSAEEEEESGDLEEAAEGPEAESESAQPEAAEEATEGGDEAGPPAEEPVQESGTTPATPVMASAAARAIRTKDDGEPMRGDTRRTLESRMGVQLGDVRVHEGAAARESAKTMNARAFTHGRDIFMGPGESQRDVRLMAHETTHVLQQNAIVRRKPLEEDDEDEEKKETAKEGEGEAKKGTEQTSAKAPQKAPEKAPEKTVEKAAATTPTAEPAAVPPAAAPSAPGPAGAAGPVAVPAVEPKGAGKAAKGEAVAPGGGPKKAAPEPAAAAASPEADPRYKAVIARVEKKAKMTRAHEPAATKVSAARKAAVPPANDRKSRAQASQVDVMAAQEPEKPKPQDFLSLLRAKLAEIAPSNMEQTADFKNSGKAGAMKASLTAEVSAQKEQSTAGIEGAAKAEPDEASVEATTETPLGPEEADKKTPAVDAEEVLPEPKSDEEVSVKANQDEAEQAMAENDVDEEQLREANEPQFAAVADAKAELDAHVESVPEEYRAAEDAELAASRAELGAEEKKSASDLKQTRERSKKSVSSKQEEAKKREEAERKKVADDIEGMYQKTRKAVEAKLAGLDSEVDTMFDAGEKTARERFEAYVDKRMSDYKWDRYISQLGGSLLWASDKLFGMPDEVNRFYEEGRDQYLADMDVVLVRIATTVETRLKEAKDEIAKGREAIAKYVRELPKTLQKAGEDAEKSVGSRFEELETSVNSKKDALVEKLATKAKEARGKLDDRIKALKAANQGLLDALLAKLMEIVLILKNFKEKISSLFQEGAGVVRKIVKAPVKFLKNLLAAVKLGFSQFKDNILEHLKKGLLGWLFGALAGAGIEIPSEFSVKAIFGLVMQVLGITRERMRAKLVKLIGEKNVGRIEMAWTFVSKLIEEGPAGLWAKIQEFLHDLKEKVMEGVREFVITAIVKAAVLWLISLFNPVSALLKAIKAIYDVVMFFVERIDQILEIVQAIVKSVGKIVAGQIGDAANWVEKVMGRAVPVVISFLAAILGLGGISGKIKGVILKLQDRVDKAIDKVIKKVVKSLKKFVKKGKAAVKKGYEKVKNFLFPKKKFQAGEESHTIYVDPKSSPPRAMIATTPAQIDKFLDSLTTRPGVQGKAAKLARIRTAKGRVPGMRQLIKQVEKAAKGKKQRNTTALTKRLADVETELAKDLQFILAGVKSAKSDVEKYRLEGLVATYATMPRQKGDRMTPDHQPAKSVLSVIGKMKDFKGTRAEKVGKAGGVPEGVSINIFHDRHVAGRTYGGKGKTTKGQFSKKLADNLKGVTDRGKRQDVAISLVRGELRSDAKAMENVYGDTKGAFYKDVTDDKLKSAIKTQGKAGLNRIRAQDLDSLKQ
jgi:hypothetical protein